MTQYFLGIDIGGTKSHALIADEYGHMLGFGRSGSGKREGDDYSPVGRISKLIMNEALADAGITKDQIAGAGFGISDYDWPSQRQPHLDSLTVLGLTAPVEIVNDSLLGLIAGTSAGWGISVIAGTGCNCIGRDRTRKHIGRVTGFGYHMGEAAGAIELVQAAKQKVAAAWCKTGPPTQLTDTFVDLMGARDVVDLLEGLTLNRYDIPHSAAPLIFQAAEAGDEVARELVRWAGRELGKLAVGVCRQLNFEGIAFETILSGSLFKGHPLLIEELQNTLRPIAPYAQFVTLEPPPVIGAVLLGMEQARITLPSLAAARQMLLAAPIPA